MARGGVMRQGAPTIERLDPRLLTGETTYLFNIYSTEQNINLGTSGQYYIPPCPEGKEWVRSPTPVPGTVENVYPHFMDREEYRNAPQPGEDVVKFCLGIGSGQSKDEDLRRFGIFASTSSKPSKEELAEARKRLIVELQREVREADQLFASADALDRQSAQNDKYYKAARYLGLKNKAWMSDATEVTACPFCGTGMRPGVPVCPGCKEVVNQVLYDQLKQSVSAGKAA